MKPMLSGEVSSWLVCGLCFISAGMSYGYSAPIDLGQVKGVRLAIYSGIEAFFGAKMFTADSVRVSSSFSDLYKGMPESRLREVLDECARKSRVVVGICSDEDACNVCFEFVYKIDEVSYTQRVSIRFKLKQGVVDSVYLVGGSIVQQP